MSAPTSPEGAPETILCDTSFVSVVQAKGVQAKWAETDRDRLNRAVLAISVMTLAELRAGQLMAGWGATRRARAEQLIAAYLWVPLDMPIVDEWASLRAEAAKAGVTVPHNDLWIAATARVRGCTLVSCDKQFDLLPGVDHLRLEKP